MKPLNFPSYEHRLKKSGNKTLIFDTIRKKFVVLQPEEWVRQHCVNYLLNVKKYPISLLNVEKELKINGIKKRYDIVLYNTDGSIFLIVECKAYNISLNQHVFDQIARYNLTLNSKYLMVTNGINHYYCTMDYQKKEYKFLKDIPNFQ